MIVMKFGGSSLESADAIRNVADILQSKRDKKPIVVLSAVAGVTDKLLDCIYAALEGNAETAIEGISAIHDQHHQIADELSIASEWRTLFNDTLDEYRNELQEFMTGAALVQNISTRSIDRMLPFGERYSTLLFVTYLNTIGMNAKLLDATDFIITTNNHTKAVPLLEPSREKIEQAIPPVFDEGKLPIVQGFIGSAIDGAAITTLGRGGSDYTASIIGTALKTDEIQIWASVDGILTADPYVVPHAKVVERMTFREAAELAYFGARVLHPDSILPAVEQDIPIHIYNSRNLESPGSLIRTSFDDEEQSAVKSIAYKEDIKVINLTSTRMFQAHDFLRKVFEVMDRHEMVADLVSTSEVSVSIAFHRYPNYEKVVNDLSKFSKVSVDTGKAIVCLVGEHMRERQGLPGIILGILNDVHINMISQGASEVNLSFIINEEDIERVVTTLHSEFFPK